MEWLDRNSNVLEWTSEEHIIPYLSPIDNKYHRYFPDFVAKIKVTKSVINEIATWGINEAKWDAALSFCQDRGWEFKIITEKELNIK